MSKALPRAVKIKLNQHQTLPTREQLDGFGCGIVLLPETVLKGRWPDLPYADVLKARAARAKDRTANGLLLTTDLPNPDGTRLACAAITTDAAAFDRLSLARELVAALKPWPTRLAVILAGLDPATASAYAEALCAALLAATAELPSYKRRPAAASALKTLDIYGLAAAQDFSRTRAEAAGNALARYLTQLPPNELTPARYRQRVATLAKQQGWRMRFLDQAKLQQLGAGAFLAVAQGSAEADAGILHLRYTPKKKSVRKSPLALVGKGICFDTGGNNLKSAKYMLGMHEDMAGSAVALGTLLALTVLKVDYPIDCWLALAQNHIGPKAYKPNDVVTACNGTTIEVIHTDAEGRMVLADTLALAGREKPALMLDYATLTGSCVTALGTRYSGAFSNRTAFIAKIIDAGVTSGERVWPFPTDADYDKALDSDIADVKQCTLDSEADHILAVRFLDRFVPASVPWIHIDLSAANHKGGLAHVPSDVTGFGVRYTLELLGKLLQPRQSGSGR